ncbi:zinc finger CCCH domain-containing protein 54-like [Euphorbia lathyris]|uniref:zinc finger CCCH domain-containing protein 54-like n=1 Tax=Euphorbia lathyris TaxID=212925 RepID=UPI003313D2D9
MYFPPHYVDIDVELHSFPRGHETSRLLRKQLIEEQEQVLEFQRRRLAGLQAARNTMGNQSYFAYSMDALKVSEDNFNFPSVKPFSFLFDALNNDPTSNDKIRLTEANYTDQSSQGLNIRTTFNYLSRGGSVKS